MDDEQLRYLIEGLVLFSLTLAYLTNPDRMLRELLK